MPLGILDVKWKMRVYNQETLNTRSYATSAGSAADLGADLATYFFPNILPVFGGDVEFLELLVQDRLDPTNAYHTSLAGNIGQASTEALPAFAGVGFYFPTSTPGQRGGSNRIAGVTEGQVIGEDISPTWLPLWEAIGAVLGTIITTAAAEYIPLVIREEVDQWIAYMITDYIVKRVTTQNSRKGYTGSTVSLGNEVVMTATPTPVSLGSVSAIVTHYNCTKATASKTLSGNSFPFFVSKPTLSIPEWVEPV